MGTESAKPSADIQVPVLIVGGGGAGLTCSMLLAQLGIKALLVSSLPTTSILPKAHVLNQRTMEILGDVGVAEPIYAKSTPAENMAAMGWYAGFAGPDPEFGRQIGKVETWGCGYTNLNWVQASACRSANLPQIRLEPIMKARAEELNPGAIRFHHELTKLEQDSDGVTAWIKNHDTGVDYTVRARYLLGCDGGRTIPRLVGIPYEGLGALAQTATAHVSADLSRLALDPDVLIRWIWCPAIGEMAVLVPMGPDHWGPDSEEWVFHVTYQGEGPKDLTDEQIEANMRRALDIDVPMKVHKITRWALEGVLAPRFRVGRAFLVGDSAHRHPPTGGLGLTSGIQDAHNLCWKLAAVLAGHASPALLDTYEPERRPSLSRNAQRSLENAVNHFTIAGATVSPENTTEQNWASLKRLWSGRPEDAEHRAEVLRMMRAQSMEFCEHNVEYGYTYDSAAIVDDGSQPPEPVEEIRVYEPSTRPGSPLPHAWIDDEDQARRPIKDLVQPGRFLLIAGEDAQEWCRAARELAGEHGLPVDTVRIGHLDGDMFDPRCTWLRCREIGAEGAILVRPDRFVAWRSVGAFQDPVAELAGAFSQILARPVAVHDAAAAS